MNNKQWDEYVTRQEGTFCGDIAAKNMKSAMKPPEQYFIPNKVVSSPKPIPDKIRLYPLLINYLHQLALTQYFHLF